jgi:hypothetical protein
MLTVAADTHPRGVCAPRLVDVLMNQTNRRMT